MKKSKVALSVILSVRLLAVLAIGLSGMFFEPAPTGLAAEQQSSDQSTNTQSANLQQTNTEQTNTEQTHAEQTNTEQDSNKQNEPKTSAKTSVNNGSKAGELNPTPQVGVGPDGCGDYVPGLSDYFLGSGSGSDPWQIGPSGGKEGPVAYQLAQLACLVNNGIRTYSRDSYIITDQNIDLSEWGSWDTSREAQSNWQSIYGVSDSQYQATEYGWIPIGLRKTLPFEGYITAINSTITGLRIDRTLSPSSSEYSIAGLFGYTSSATINGLMLKSTNIESYQGGAGLVYSAYNTIIRGCYVEGNIAAGFGGSQKMFVGGLVGELTGASFLDTSYSSADVQRIVYDPGSGTGGLVGSVIGTTIIRQAYATGNVIGAEATGGFVGYQAETTKINDSYARGNVNGTSWVGGFVGQIYSSGAFSSTPSDTDCSIRFAYSLGDVIATGSYAGGFAGGMYFSNLKATYTRIQSVAAIGRVVSAQSDYYKFMSVYPTNYKYDNNNVSYNYVWSGVGASSSDICATSIISGQVPISNDTRLDGNLFSSSELAQSNIFSNLMGFSQSNGWVLKTGALPILSTVPNLSGNPQSSAIPEYITGTIFSGTGVPGDRYKIPDAFSLAQLGCLVNEGVTAYSKAFYELSSTSSINLSNWGKWTEGTSSTSRTNWKKLYPAGSAQLIASQNGWIPIGTQSNPFLGNIKVGSAGSLQTITNLTIDRELSSSSYNQSGLFGYVGSYLDTCVDSSTTEKGCQISDIWLENVSIKSWSGAGSLVANLINGIVSSSYATGDVEGMYSGGTNYPTGGLVGSLGSKGSVISSFAIVNVHTASDLGDSVGGLIGSAVSASVTGSYAKGDVIGRSSVGGLIGYAESTSIVANYSVNNVQGRNYVGGLIGQLRCKQYSSTYYFLQYSYSASNVLGTGTSGGFIGFLSADSTYSIDVKLVSNYVVGATVYSSGTSTNYHKFIGEISSEISLTSSTYYDNNVWAGMGTSVGNVCGMDKTVGSIPTGTQFTDGISMSSDIFVGRNPFLDSGFSNNALWYVQAGKLPILYSLPNASVYPQSADLPIYLPNKVYFSGSGTSQSPYLIASEKELAALACLVNKADQTYNSYGKEYKLSANLNLVSWQTWSSSENPVSASQLNWKSIYGSSSSVGQGGWVPIGTASTPFLGNFDGDGKVISNLKIDRQESTSDIAQGAAGLFSFIQGQSAATRNVLKNIGINGVSIKNYYGAGGLVGQLKSTDIQNSYVLGIADSVIQGCLTSSSEQNCTSGYAGGLAGQVTQGSIISSSFASVAQIKAIDNVGGLAGVLQASKISNSYSSGGLITAKGNAGQIAEMGKAGGLVGFLVQGTGTYTNSITSSYSSNNVLAAGSNIARAGGLAGAAIAVDLTKPMIESSVAYQATINGEAALIQIHRILGFLQSSSDNPNLAGNYALDSMGTDETNNCGQETITGDFSGDKTETSLNGANVTRNDLTASADNWFRVNHGGFTGWNATIWNFSSSTFGKPTYLLNMPGSPSQIADFGNYISQNPYFTGNGSSATPYQIGTSSNLATLACLVNDGETEYNNPAVYYKLTQDLDLNAYGGNGSTWTDPDGVSQTHGWMPIGKGTDDSRNFLANFDGNYKVISNLGISSQTGLYQGLFGKIAPPSSAVNNLQIKNFGIKGANITMGENNYAGAVAGEIYKGQISGVWVNTSKIIMSKKAIRVGGLVGGIYNSVLNNSYASSLIEYTSADNFEETSYVGGIVGVDGGSSQIANVYAMGSIKMGSNTTTHYIGGLAGQLVSGASLQNSVALNSVLNSPNKPAGSNPDFVYRIAGQSAGTLQNNYAWELISRGLVNICGLSNLLIGVFPEAGLHNNQNGADLSYSSLSTSNWFSVSHSNWTPWTQAQGWTLASGLAPVLSNYTASSQTNAYPDYFTYPGAFTGGGTVINPYQISSEEQLARLACLVNNSQTYSNFGDTGINYKLMSDINLTNWGAYTGTSGTIYNNWRNIYGINSAPLSAAQGGWLPIGLSSTYAFRGNFDGNSKIIANLKIDRASVDETNVSSYSGLFGWTGKTGDSYSIRNFSLQAVSIKSAKGAGAAVGYSEGGNISGISVVGSIEGCTYGACPTSATEGQETGGLVGYMKTGSVLSSYASVAMVGKSNVGGLVGRASNGSSITNSYLGNLATAVSESSVTGQENVGGIVGKLEGGNAQSISKIYKVYSTGTVSGNSNVGGVAGYITSYVNISSSVALQKTINSQDSNFHRVVGFSNSTSNVVLAGNYAINNMGTKLVQTCSLNYISGTIPGDKGVNTVNGADVAYSALSGTNWFGVAHDTGWTSWSVADPDDAWTLSSGRIPLLKNVISQPTQSNYFPAYLSYSAIFTGAGALQDPYLISSAKQLAQLACLVNEGSQEFNKSGVYYKIADSVSQFDLGQWGVWQDSESPASQSQTNWKSVYSSPSEVLEDTKTGWIPIGSQTSPFLGNFDGNGKVITNLTISRQNTSPYTVTAAGLFGFVAKQGSYSSVIKGMALENVSIVNFTRAGGLVGAADGAGTSLGVEIKSSYVQGSVLGCASSVCSSSSAAYSTGGIVGSANNTYISYSYVDAIIEGAQRTGGIVGSLVDSDIYYAYSSGSVKGTNATGGIAGHFESTTQDSADYNLTNTYSTMSVIVNGTGSGGGIAGYVSNVSLKYNTALNSYIKSTGSSSFIHRIAGQTANVPQLSNYALEYLGTDDNEVCGQHNITGSSYFSNYKTVSEQNGADVSTNDLNTTNWFGTAHTGWVAWNSNDWNMNVAVLPTLKAVVNSSKQNTSYPQYITGGTYFQGGGTATNPYSISTPRDLAELSCLVRDGVAQYNSDSVFYKQSSDLDLTAYKNEWSDLSNSSVLISGGWLPIGNTNNPFVANYNGDNYSVYNMSITRTTDQNPKGLFGAVSSNSTTYIKNLGIYASSINSRDSYEGLLAGSVNGFQISNIWGQGIVSGQNNSSSGPSIGGLIGQAITSGNLTNSSFSGNVTATGQDASAAGLVGSINNFTISNVYTLGNVASTSFSGGIVSKSTAGAISNSAAFNTQVSSSQTSLVGRIVADQSATNLSQNYAWNNMSQNLITLCGGGILENLLGPGAVDNKNGADVSYDDLSNSSRNWFGRNGTSSAPWTAWTTADGWNLQNGKMAILTEKTSPAKQDNTPPAVLNVKAFFTGDGASWDSAYQISTPLQLAQLACLVNSPNAQEFNTNNTYYKLTADLNLSDWGPYYHDAVNPTASEQNWRSLYNISDNDASFNFTNSGWSSIGGQQYPFKANFDGQNTEISNLSANDVNYAVPGTNTPMGLFGLVAGVNDQQHISIRNLSLENTNINSKGLSGAVAAKASYLDINNVYINNENKLAGGIVGCAEISFCDSTSGVGAILGSSQYFNISNSSSSLHVEGQGNVGGLVGFGEFGSIMSSYSSSNVYSDDGQAGGIIGATDRTFSLDNLYFSGSVTATLNAAGIVGLSANNSQTDTTLTINHTFVLGNVEATDTARSSAAGILAEINTATGKTSTVNISNSVSANNGVLAISSNSARIAKYSTTPAITLSNNYAWDKTLVNNELITSDNPTAVLTGINGKNITAKEVLNSSGFWTATPTGTVDGVAFSTSIWHIQSGQGNNWIPVLGGFGLVANPAPSGFDNSIMPNDIGAQDGNAADYIQDSSTTHMVMFYAAPQSILSQSYEYSQNYTLSNIFPTKFGWNAPPNSYFDKWCIQGTDCSAGNFWNPDLGGYSIWEDVIFVAHYCMNPPQNIEVNKLSEQITNLQSSQIYYFSPSVISYNQFNQVCANPPSSANYVSGANNLALSALSLPEDRAAQDTVLRYVICGQNGAEASIIQSLTVPARQSPPTSTADYSVINPQYTTQFTSLTAKVGLMIAWSPDGTDCSSTLNYTMVDAGRNFDTDRLGALCIRRQATVDNFYSRAALLPVVQGRDTPPISIAPHILTINGQSSGNFFVSRQGTAGQTFHVTGLNLQSQGNFAGHIKIFADHAVEFPMAGNTEPYLTNVNPQGTSADIIIPTSDLASVNMNNMIGRQVSLILPSDLYGDSDYFQFYYVEKVNYSSIYPATSLAQGSPISITGSNFKFGNIDNVSKVEVCQSDLSCQAANFIVDAPTRIVLQTPPYPNGTQAKIRVYNKAGEVTVNDSSILTYAVPGQFSRIWLPDLNIPAGSRQNLQIIGLDANGNSLGDLGSYISNSNTNQRGFITPGQNGGSAVLEVGSNVGGPYEMSVTVTYQGIIRTYVFRVTILQPSVVNAFISPINLKMIAGIGNIATVKAYATNSLGQQINISRQLDWSLSGAGFIEISGSNDYATITSNGAVGSFYIRAKTSDYLGQEINLEGTLQTLESSGDYVDNVAAVPVSVNPNSVEVTWNAFNKDSVSGYKVNIYNTFNGLAGTQTVSVDSTSARFDNLFSGSYHVDVSAVLPGGTSQPVPNNQQQNPKFYLTSQQTNVSLTDLGGLSADATNSIYWLVKYSVTTGTTPTTFSPYGITNRQQMAAFFQRLAGNPPSSGGPVFQDQNKTAPTLSEAVKWLAGTGVSTGYVCTAKKKPYPECTGRGVIFRPTVKVTRVQMALFMYKYAKYPDISQAQIDYQISQLSDKAKIIGGEQQRAVAWLMMTGISTGTSAGVFSPNNNVTRNQMAMFLNRLGTKSEAVK
jgi:hypothetical protein